MKIFLSAASGQLVECRDLLATALRKRGVEPVVQETFTQFDGTVLEKLQARVDGCDRVVILVGTAYGAEPNERVRGDRPRRSYSQWEYHFAMGERLDGKTVARKSSLIYLAHKDYLAAHPYKSDQTDDQTRLQAEFRDKLDNGDRDRTKFRSCDELGHLVLADLGDVGGPAPEPRPRPHNLRFDSLGTLFKGRDEFLDDLRMKLTGAAGGPVAIVTKQAIHGLGGVGKTRAAIEYGWKFQEDYSALLFVSAPDPASLRANLADLVGVLAVDAGAMDGATEEQRVAEVLAWLRKNPRWLLILDNVDTPEAAKEAHSLLAKLSGGDVLITSRISNWPAGVRPLELHVLRPAAASEFLLERTEHRPIKPDDAAVAAEIARELDGLALALEQAGAYIVKRRLSLAQYLADWKGKRPQVLAWHDPRVMKYPASVAVTWETTFARVGEPERRLLRILASLAPEPIPPSFFEAEALQAALDDPREALGDLAEYSLVRLTTENDSVEVHRLVQEIVRSRSTDEERGRALRVALEVLAELVPYDTDDVRTWGTWLPLTAHAELVVWAADRGGIAEPTSRLMNQQGLFLKTRGQFAAAEPLFRRAVAIGEAFYGPDHRGVAAPLSNLAVLLQAINRLVEAEPLLRRALAIAEASNGPGHPEVAVHLSNLAVLLQATNRLVEAEPHYRRALAIGEATYGPDHPQVSIYLSNLARLLRATSRLVGAEPHYRRALAIDEASLGPDHPQVAKRLSNLAELLQATSRLGEAEPLFRRALAIDEASLGPNHPQVAAGLSNLALLLQATSRPVEAEPLFCRALAIAEVSYGPNHPEVAVRLNNFAMLLRATSRLAEAEPLLRRGLMILVKFQLQNGYEHPNFRVGLGNYGGCLEELGLTPEQIDQRFRDIDQGVAQDTPPPAGSSDPSRPGGSS